MVYNLILILLNIFLNFIYFKNNFVYQIFTIHKVYTIAQIIAILKMNFNNYFFYYPQNLHNFFFIIINHFNPIFIKFTNFHIFYILFLLVIIVQQSKSNHTYFYFSKFNQTIFFKQEYCHLDLSNFDYNFFKKLKDFTNFKKPHNFLFKKLKNLTNFLYFMECIGCNFIIFNRDCFG